MLQDIYYSRKSNKAVQVISQCRILPDGTHAICFQELSDNYEVYVMAVEHFSRIFYRKESDGRQTGSVREQVIQNKEEEKVSDIVRFLDAETYAEKIKILEAMKDDLDAHMLNNMAVSLDLSIEDGVDGYSFLMSELRIRSRFEGKRGERL